MNCHHEEREEGRRDDRPSATRDLLFVSPAKLESRAPSSLPIPINDE